MPHSDPEKRREYQRARHAKLKSEDPEWTRKLAERTAANHAKRQATDEAYKQRRAEMHKRWYDEYGTEYAREKYGRMPMDEYIALKEQERIQKAEYMREWYHTEAGKRASVAQRVKKRCGMTIDQYDAAYDAQEGKCRICGEFAERYGEGRLHVDHCHTSGKFRALLCGKCNTAIGLLGESKEILHSAIQYLQDIEEGNVGVQEEVAVRIRSIILNRMVHVYNYFGSGEDGKLFSQKQFGYWMRTKRDILSKCIPCN